MTTPRNLSRLAVAAALMLAGCGPSASDVCGHLDALAKGEAKPGAQVELAGEACEAALERQRAQLSSAAWGQKARCILAADSLSAVDAC